MLETPDAGGPPQLRVLDDDGQEQWQAAVPIRSDETATIAMGDALGAAKMLTVLEAMHSFYQDPRYRPSPWLKRRARLGISLLTPE